MHLVFAYFYANKKSINMNLRIKILLFAICGSLQIVVAQGRINWTADGLAYTKFSNGNIVRVDPKTNAETVVIKKEQLTPPGSTALNPQSFEYRSDFKKMI